jgi:hypothetical protein
MKEQTDMCIYIYIYIYTYVVYQLAVAFLSVRTTTGCMEEETRQKFIFLPF